MGRRLTRNCLLLLLSPIRGAMGCLIKTKYVLLNDLHYVIVPQGGASTWRCSRANGFTSQAFFCPSWEAYFPSRSYPNVTFVYQTPCCPRLPPPSQARILHRKGKTRSPVCPRIIPVQETQVSMVGGGDDYSGERVGRTAGTAVVPLPFWCGSGRGNLGVGFPKPGCSHLEFREVQFWLHACFEFRENCSRDFGTVNLSYRTTVTKVCSCCSIGVSSM